MEPSQPAENKDNVVVLARTEKITRGVKRSCYKLSSVTPLPDISSLTLAGALGTTGPMLSVELIKQLIAQGVSPAAARQRLARGLADESVKRLAGLRFAHNARFLYRSDQFGDRRFWDALEKAFETHGPSYSGAVANLRARGGSVPRSLFATVAGAPLGRKRQLSPDRILERLTAINLLKEEAAEDGGSNVIFVPQHLTRDPPGLIRARLIAEQVALLGLKDWIRRVGMGSFDSVRIRGDVQSPEVASLVWDLSAPSYLRPLRRVSAEGTRPGFVVCDINLRDTVPNDAMRAFVRKCDLAAAPQGIAPIMPIFIADVFSPEAFALGRQKGIMATTVELLLGQAVAAALRDLIKMLSDLGATAATRPELIETVFGSLSRIEGAAGNLRGPLLELVVAHLVKEIEQGSIIVGRNVIDRTTGKRADIDVQLIRPENAGSLIIECKAKEPGGRLGLDAVTKWRNDRVPVTFSAIQGEERFRSQPLRFEIWTNAPIDPDALAWLKANAQSTSEFELGWRGGPELRKYAGGAKSAAISKILNEHFYQKPLAKKKTSR